MKQKIITRRGIKIVDLNPRRAIRRHCHMCSDYSWEEVEACNVVECELHIFRLGTSFNKDLAPNDRSGAIYRYCLHQCSGEDEKRYQNCDMQVCPLFSFRLKNIRQPIAICAV